MSILSILELGSELNLATTTATDSALVGFLAVAVLLWILVRYRRHLTAAQPSLAR